MRKLVDEEIQCDDSTPAPLDEYSNSPDDNSELIFGAETPSTNQEDLTPNPSHIVRLWQIYLDRCNPLTKVIHVPTVQPYVLEATSNAPNLPKNVEALLFAIYTLAVVSMTKEESEEVLGMPREKALARFSAGLRSCMIRLGFLKTHDLFTLQALVIYLVGILFFMCLAPGSPWLTAADFLARQVQPPCILDPEWGRHPHRSEDGFASRW